jgi:LDH2 family malate/lactate/ureidoglycolate dehydrogenase
MTNETWTRVDPDALRTFSEEVFRALGVNEEDARITTDVLLAADLRGIDSHGVARLRRYVNGLQQGIMDPRPQIHTVTETPVTATVDGGAGLGQPVSYRAMKRAIDKAQEYGAGFVTVRNSNHYGIAGYYAMMALDADCIGFSMTNAGTLVNPTFGRNAMLGTNPIAVAAPAGEERPFVLDMATSTVPQGKLEVYSRLEKSIPLGWATDETGTPTEDTLRVLDNLKQRHGGGLLPLGGAGEEMSGHKGYGLGLWVDIFCAVLSGAAYSNLTYPKTAEGKPLPSNIGHFFGAWRVEAFRPVEAFKASMDDLQQRLKETPKADDAERIYIHGEKEYEEAERRSREGIPLNPKVAADLRAIGAEVGVPYEVEG